MRKWNILLTLAIAGVLLVPGAVVGTAVSACCGVTPILLQASDTPDPVCLGAPVTISGSYNVYTVWGEATQVYDTGAQIKIFDSGAVKVAEFNLLLGDDEPNPGPSPGTAWPFSQGWTPAVAGAYTYTVVAWSTTTFGTMTTDAVGGGFVAKQCATVDVKPGSCPNSFNIGDKGVLPVGITGGEDFDATLVSSVNMTGPGGTIYPVKSEIKDTAKPDDIEGPLCTDCLSYEPTCVDTNADGIADYCYVDEIDDLIVYFDSQAVTGILGSVVRDQCVVVTVNFTYDGNAMSSTDVIRIITKK
jgi:hypothetical protein